ncbi:YwqG family protein [Acrocarpospora sp. B8E8]|uniref:YwqG family protein n=1 Tax=Acrocarpospora sp. B8E8 TaxID=3153572 RepID=UPI00325D5C3A
MTEDWSTDFAEFVRAELPTETAERLIGLLRPAIGLSAAEDGEIVVGRLGGAAKLPTGMAWPLRAGGWPMSFVAELDCGKLSGYEVDIALPDTGTLLFFVSAEVSQSQVIHVPPGTTVAELPAPDRAEVYAELPLAASTEPSWPARNHPALVDLFGSLDEAEEAVWDRVLDEDAGETFAEELLMYEGAWDSGPPHQVGGYSDALHTPVEAAAAHDAGTGWYGDPAFQEEARQWVTLLQVAEETRARMIWGDGAYLIWGIRKDHLAARDFSKVYVHIQGH